MIGGTVIGITRYADGNVRLYLEDRTYSNDRICVMTQEQTVAREGRPSCPVEIRVGDNVWWQSGKVYWNPSDKIRLPDERQLDIALPKIGYSFGFAHVKGE